MKIVVEIEVEDLQHARSAMGHAYATVQSFAMAGGMPLPKNGEGRIPLKAFGQQVGKFTIDTRRD